MIRTAAAILGLAALGYTMNASQTAALAQAANTPPTAAPVQRLSETEMRRRINEWVVGVAAGKLEGAPVRLVEELSRVLDDGNEMQILPVITRGPSYNVHALLYLRGIDLAVVNGDVLDYFGKERKIPRIRTRINYVTQLFNSELHIIARPEIKTLADLKGKEVNFNTKGTSAAFTGSIIFDRLKIGAKKTFIPHPVALRQIKTGERFAALVFVTAKPVRALARRKWPAGFHLLPVPFSDAVADTYLPVTFEHADYPDIIAKGSTVDTLAVPTVLAAFNWSGGNPRQQKVARFVDYLFDRFDRLRKPPFHPKWRSINLAAKIPGWSRLPGVEEKLAEFNREREAKTSAIPPAIRQRARQVAPNDPAAQKVLFDEFLRWYRQRKAQQTGN